MALTALGWAAKAKASGSLGLKFVCLETSQNCSHCANSTRKRRPAIPALSNSQKPSTPKLGTEHGIAGDTLTMAHLSEPGKVLKPATIRSRKAGLPFAAQATRSASTSRCDHWRETSCVKPAT